MSGGIDSSVSAALLKRAGFNVRGVFLKLYDSPRFKDGEKRAKKVAQVLKIPIETLDLRKEFKKIVIDYFLKEYQAGRTPNPCVVCNKEIKLGLLLSKALGSGIDLLATGHYVKKVDAKLLKAKDKKKDQSYFLWQLNQKQLKHILFPMGDYTKAQVRKLARRFKVPVLQVPESQEICFIQTTVNDFLTRYLKQKPGKIVDSQGKVLGNHQGLAFYTIGQRKGISLPQGPYWVRDKDLKRNLLIVTKKERDLYKKELIAKNVNWLLGKKPKLPLKIKAKIRYRHQATEATIYKNYKIVFDRSQRAITPGQSVVFYRDEELLGGGIID